MNVITSIDIFVTLYRYINHDSMVIKSYTPSEGEFSYCVFLEQLFWVSSFCQTVLCQPENLLQLHSGFIKPFHEAAVGLHVLPPLRRLLYQGLDKQNIQ